MTQRLSLISIIVDDYDRAIGFYVGQLGFDLREDTRLSETRRWVVVAPAGAETGLLLAQAADDRQRAAIGEQGAGRVLLFLQTDDFAADHQRLAAAGVTFVEEPRHEAYGSVAVFEDLYGNRWDLIQHAPR